MVTASKFEHRESYKHKMAKELLSQWLADAGDSNSDYWSYSLVSGQDLRWRPNCGSAVFMEYPFTLEGYGYSPTWDEVDKFWADEETLIDITFENCIAAGYYPCLVADIALRHKGTIGAVIEVVHKSPVSPEKLSKYRQIDGPLVYTVSAEWVLGQIGQPSALALERVF